MSEKVAVSENEISLLDVYQFLKSGSATLVFCSALGLTLGFATAIILPEQFQASALIEPATVSKKEKDSIVKTSVEVSAVLVEKMKLPT
jgi:LPS O-antigen subunit length determinant protein (WzzB/FepE family)